METSRKGSSGGALHNEGLDGRGFDLLDRRGLGTTLSEVCSFEESGRPVTRGGRWNSAVRLGG